MILEDPIDGGGVSDVIYTYNDTAGAELLFYSDPSLPVPEPSTWSILMLGGFGLGATLRGRRKTAIPATV